MEYEPFESKIPEDALEVLLESGEELGIDPLSSTESEEYFLNLLSRFDGAEEELAAYLKKQMQKDFIALKEKPEWLQGDAWQFHHGRPMCFVGQMEVPVNRDGCVYTFMFYVFWDMEDGETRTIVQTD